ncbi:MAG: hypothetical protein ACRDTZ_11060 [Pseudonocardiaceae bacterium]
MSETSEPQRRGDWIQLISGEPFWPLDPRPEEIHIEDIAWALSMLCRYGGHVKRFYSVVEHSVQVSHLVPDRYALEGLLHDAAEAYLVDVPRPIKRQIPEYKRIEAGLERCIAECFELTHPMPAEVKEADAGIVASERAQLLALSVREWGDAQSETSGGNRLEVTLPCWKPEEARTAFLQRYEALTGRLR